MAIRMRGPVLAVLAALALLFGPTAAAEEEVLVLDDPATVDGAPAVEVYSATAMGAPSAADITLFDQTATSFYLVSSTNQTQPVGFADDFVVPGGAAWTVSYVSVVLFVRDVQAVSPPTVLPDVDVHIAANESGQPGVPPIATQTIGAGSLIWAQQQPYGTNAMVTRAVLPLVSPVTLTAGTYWIEVLPRPVPSIEMLGLHTTPDLSGSRILRAYGSPSGVVTVPFPASGSAAMINGLVFGLYTRAPVFSGPFAPVDPLPVVNVVKAGATVPVKWTAAWADDGTAASDLSMLRTANVTTYACDTQAVYDQIEWTATGGTSLRWDDASQAFVFNFKTPRTPGRCATLTMVLATNQRITALFRLR